MLTMEKVYWFWRSQFKGEGHDGYHWQMWGARGCYTLRYICFTNTSCFHYFQWLYGNTTCLVLSYKWWEDVHCGGKGHDTGAGRFSAWLWLIVHLLISDGKIFTLIVMDTTQELEDSDLYSQHIMLKLETVKQCAFLLWFIMYCYYGYCNSFIICDTKLLYYLPD